MKSFAVTIVVIGGVLVAFNVAINRGMDHYYDRQAAVLALPPTDPAFLKAAESAKAAAAEDVASAEPTATVSAN